MIHAFEKKKANYVNPTDSTTHGREVRQVYTDCKLTLPPATPHCALHTEHNSVLWFLKTLTNPTSVSKSHHGMLTLLSKEFRTLDPLCLCILLPIMSCPGFEEEEKSLLYLRNKRYIIFLLLTPIKQKLHFLDRVNGSAF